MGLSINWYDFGYFDEIFQFNFIEMAVQMFANVYPHVEKMYKLISILRQYGGCPALNPKMI